MMMCKNYVMTSHAQSRSPMCSDVFSVVNMVVSLPWYSWHGHRCLSQASSVSCALPLSLVHVHLAVLYKCLHVSILL